MTEQMTEEEIRKACEPKSDQLNYEDVQNQPLIVTITAVKRGDKEQPVVIHLEGQRPFKPCKTMRRVLVAAWSSDSKLWVGRKMTLYGDPKVKFGGVEVGGIRISHLSHIDKPLELPLMVSRAKRVPHRIDPIVDPRIPKFRAWLKKHQISEQEATEAIGGRSLEDATEEDWATLKNWATVKPETENTH